VLLTRSPLGLTPKGNPPHDLHVLGTPPAFILSQDQTLHKRSLYLAQKNQQAMLHSLVFKEHIVVLLVCRFLAATFVILTRP
jgi:hypothetical protein